MHRTREFLLYRSSSPGRVLTLEIVRLHRYARRPVGKLTDLQAHFRQWVTFGVRIAPTAVVLHPRRKLFRPFQHLHHLPRPPRQTVTAVVVQPRYAHVFVFPWNPTKDNTYNVIAKIILRDTSSNEMDIKYIFFYLHVTFTILICYFNFVNLLFEKTITLTFNLIHKYVTSTDFEAEIIVTWVLKNDTKYGT